MSKLKFDNANQVKGMINKDLLEQFREINRLTDILTDEIHARLTEDAFSSETTMAIKENILIQASISNKFGRK